MTITKPMLAASLETIDSIKFPVYATPKLDGIRCLKIDGQIVSRTFKPIRNAELAAAVKDLLPDGSDGELIMGGTFQNTTSMVMSADKTIGNEKAYFYWFDYLVEDPKKSYLGRMEDMKKFVEEHPEILTASPVKIVPLVPTEINTIEDLLKYETEVLEQGFEGVMLRTAHGPYKFGRSTLKEGSLVKMKKFDDDEAIVIGFNELMKNTNEKTKDEFGYAKRSSHKSGKVDQDTLGSLDVNWNGIHFSIGSGFTADQRKEFWNDRDNLMRKIVKFKYFATGMKEAPRFPIFLGFRHIDDM
jgi:DNA ligase-1